MPVPFSSFGVDAPALRKMPACLERLRGLRCLVAVVQHGSTLRASEALFLSQPTVTRSILDLEVAFSMPLFERGGRGMSPNPPGVAAARRATRLFELLAEGAAEALALSPPKGQRPPLPERFAATVGSSSLAAMLAVAVSGSESRAAHLLGMTQPSVHRALRVLEEQCGVSLLQKSARGTQLTDSGQALLLRIKLALAEARALETELAAWNGKIRGRVILGTSPLANIPMLVAAIDGLLRTHPEMEITVIDGTYDSLIQQLRSADVDLVIGALRPAPPPWALQEALFADDLVVVCRRGHPCLQVGALHVADLRRWRWVLPLPGTRSRAALQRLFDAAGLPLPHEALQATGALFTRTFMAQADCLSLAPRRQAMADRDAGHLEIAPITIADSSRAIGIYTRSIGEPSPDLQAVVEALRAAPAHGAVRPSA